MEDRILSSISNYLKSAPYAPIEEDLPASRKGRNDNIRGIDITGFPDWLNTKIRVELESGSSFIKSGSRKITTNDDTISKKAKAVSRAINLFARITIHTKVPPNKPNPNPNPINFLFTKTEPSLNPKFFTVGF